MKTIRGIFTIIWEIYILLNFLFWMIVFYLPFKYLFAKESRWKASMKLQRFFAGWLRVIMGARTIVTYEVPLDKKGTYVFAPNHASFLDILLAYKFVPTYYHFMAKGSLAKVPLFKIFFSTTHIAFERSDKEEANHAYERAVNDLKKGYSILVYPEATQNKYIGTLKDFKFGAFKMAIETQKPLVPVVCYNAGTILPHAQKLFKIASGGPGKVYIDVLKPIHPADFNNDAEALKNHVYKVMNEKLKAYYDKKNLK